MPVSVLRWYGTVINHRGVGWEPSWSSQTGVSWDTILVWKPGQSQQTGVFGHVLDASLLQGGTWTKAVRKTYKLVYVLWRGKKKRWDVNEQNRWPPFPHKYPFWLTWIVLQILSRLRLWHIHVLFKPHASHMKWTQFSRAVCRGGNGQRAITCPASQNYHHRLGSADADSDTENHEQAVY